MKNYYKILETNENATLDEIRKKYSQLALNYHPDRNGGCKEAEEKFREIKDAYVVLSNEVAKSLFDAELKQIKIKRRRINMPPTQKKSPQPDLIEDLEIELLNIIGERSGKTTLEDKALAGLGLWLTRKIKK